MNFTNKKGENLNKQSTSTNIGYKEKIIEMVQKMNNEDYLFKIYHYIIPKFNKENKEAGND